MVPATQLEGARQESGEEVGFGTQVVDLEDGDE